MPEIPLSITPKHPSLLALGFRPFFLAAGASALLAVAVWIAQLHGAIAGGPYFVGPVWHAHEMLFGYAAAVIAGFLLTAARNWTGIQTPTGPWLGALVGLWLAARIAPFLPIPPILTAAIDLSFFPALAAGLFLPLWRGKNKSNRVFLALLAGMTSASVLVHLQALGVTAGTAAAGSRLMLDLILLTLLIVAGRILPFFTESAVQGSRPVSRPWVEWATFVLAAGAAAANLFLPWSAFSGAILLGLAVVQAVRLVGWHNPRVWRIPMLAVLYTGYLWLVAGLTLDGLAGFGLAAPYQALHALTLGAIGVFTLGMMVRVTLGHTGRTMHASRLTIAAFALVNAAALARVVLPMVLPESYALWLDLSGGFWIAAFGLFLWVYAPMLVKPRADGRPG